MFLSKLTELTAETKFEPSRYLFFHMETLQQMLPLVDLMEESVALVARSSFAVGLIYRRMAELSEATGDPDEAAASYRQLLPIAE